MEQPETPQEPAPGPNPAAPVPKPELPDPKGALPIPDHFRLPFHGMMSTPTAVPSATERRYNLSLLQKSKRRRGFLTGLMAGQLLIMPMDFGGAGFFPSRPPGKLRQPGALVAGVFVGVPFSAAAV